MKLSNKHISYVKSAWLALVLMLSLLFIVVGADKFFNFLVNWETFVSEPAAMWLASSPYQLIRLFGIIQISIGIFLLLSRSLCAMYCTLAMLLFISVNLWSVSQFSVVVVHDIFLILLCVVLIVLTYALKSLDAIQSEPKKTTWSWWLLRTAYGLLFIAMGADKYLHLVLKWEGALAPGGAGLFPFHVPNLIMGLGAIEIIIGILIFTPFTALAAYIAVAWFLLITANVMALGYFFDVALRNAIMALGAYVLAQLSEAVKSLKKSVR